MISGAHVVVCSKNADADRAFFRDVLALKSADAGHGWLIFALPPGEGRVPPWRSLSNRTAHLQMAVEGEGEGEGESARYWISPMKFVLVR